MADYWKNHKGSGLPPSYNNYNNRSYNRMNNQQKWFDDVDYKKDSPMKRFKILWQSLACVGIFALVIGIFGSDHPATIPMEQTLRTWFTVDADFTAVTKMFDNMSMDADSFDRAGYEVIKANASVATINEEMVIPVAGKVTSPFGWSKQEGTTNFHQGIIIETKAGEPVKAAYDGTVLDVQPQGEHYTISLSHNNGLVTTYGNCSQVYVKVDQMIEKGEIIGLIGELAAENGQLYFETKHLGEPVDPLSLLKGKEV